LADRIIVAKYGSGYINSNKVDVKIFIMFLFRENIKESKLIINTRSLELRQLHRLLTVLSF